MKKMAWILGGIPQRCLSVLRFYNNKNIHRSTCRKDIGKKKLFWLTHYASFPAYSKEIGVKNPIPSNKEREKEVEREKRKN